MMKFGGHETFHLRDHWLFKGMNMLQQQGDLFTDTEKSIETLGVGTNMVKSIRHWLIATQMAQPHKSQMHHLKNHLKKEIHQKLIPTDMGKLLTQFDPYYDRMGTAWILHYLLSSNKEQTTTWFWFFNRFGVSEFTPESAIYHLENYCQSLDKKVNTNTLNKDIHTLLRMYVEPEFGLKTPEDINVCPLSKLSLIQKQINGAYRVNPPETNDLPIEVFGYALKTFWTKQLGRIPEFSFDEMLHKDTSPLKIFSLNTDKTIDLLDQLIEKFPKTFDKRRSGGFFSITIRHIDNKKLLSSYYRGEE